MSINLFYEVKKCENISYADPSGRKVGGRIPLVPHRSTPMLCLCRISQSNILAKKFVITQMGISYTKCRNPLLLPYAIRIKQARGESATQISSFKMCLMARAY